MYLLAVRHGATDFEGGLCETGRSEAEGMAGRLLSKHSIDEGYTTCDTASIQTANILQQECGFSPLYRAVHLSVTDREQPMLMLDAWQLATAQETLLAADVNGDQPGDEQLRKLYTDVGRWLCGAVNRIERKALIVAPAISLLAIQALVKNTEISKLDTVDPDKIYHFNVSSQMAEAISDRISHIPELSKQTAA